jgi:hypothetical protein
MEDEIKQVLVVAGVLEQLDPWGFDLLFESAWPSNRRDI